MMRCAAVVVLVMLSAGGVGGCAGSGRMAGFTELVKLESSRSCDRCAGYLLPGRIEASPETVYRIDSDLPEIFLSPGVLYTTRAELPEFLTKDGKSVPREMRVQRNAGFAGIDGSFEVFVYHMSNPAPGGAPTAPRERRVVVYAKNVGSAAAVLKPRQIMEAHGTMAKADGPESRLAYRVMEDRWERMVDEVKLEPGKGEVIAWTPRLSVNGAKGKDETGSDFVTGLVRVDVESEEAKAERQNPSPTPSPTPSLGEGASRHGVFEVTVVAIDGAVEAEDFGSAAEALLDMGARSGEGAMDLTIPPPECHVRRVVGVSKNFLWRSDDVRLNASKLDERGVSFLMAAPGIQTQQCPEAKQTQDLLLSPGFVHPETIGNYMQEYLVTLTLVNPGAAAKLVDVRFGKQDADVGVAWQVDVGDTAATRETLMDYPTLVEWAGGWRKDDLPDNTRSFFMNDLARGEAQWIAVPGKSERTVTIRMMPVGSSSLPFELRVVGR
ncbi:MAG TPA: hypothetical protein VF777_06495 [Phycisphaerales bacterium]